jgi:hypothetical protein
MTWLSCSRCMFVQYMLCLSILSSKCVCLLPTRLSGECETMIWEVHYYQQIVGLFDGENLQQHHISASTSTYTNWSLAYISSCIPHHKCKEMNELVFYSPLTSFFGIDHGLQYFRVALGCMAWFSASRWTLFRRACLWAWEHDIGWALKSDCRDFDEEK